MRTVASLFCALTALALSGCSAGGDGEASVYVMDAPADDWSAVHITFTEVSIHSSGGNETGWHTVFSDAGGVTVDLLNATGTRAAFLGAEGLAAGHYQQIRVTVSKAHGVKKDGSGVDISLPQGGELKVTKSFKVEAGKETQIVLDIDLDHALMQKNGAWSFKPVVGKVVTNLKAKGSHPAEGEVETVAMDDNAGE